MHYSMFADAVLLFFVWLNMFLQFSYWTCSTNTCRTHKYNIDLCIYCELSFPLQGRFELLVHLYEFVSYSMQPYLAVCKIQKNKEHFQQTSFRGKFEELGEMLSVYIEYDKFAIFSPLLAHCLLLLSLFFFGFVLFEEVWVVVGVENPEHILQHISSNHMHVDYNKQLMNHPMGSTIITTKPSYAKYHSN